MYLKVGKWEAWFCWSDAKRQHMLDWKTCMGDHVIHIGRLEIQFNRRMEYGKREGKGGQS